MDVCPCTFSSTSSEGMNFDELCFVCPSDPNFVCTSEDGDDDELPSIPVEEMLQQLTLQDQTEATS